MASLLLAAFPPELAGLDARSVATPLGDWIVALTGVGAIAAAVKTAGLVAVHRPERVLFVGTCGAYGAELEVGSLVAASEVVATSADELAGRAYRPEPERARWRPGWALPLRACAVAVPPAITRSEEAAAALARVAQVEHLELSGVFAACEDAGVPVAAALAVANRVGPDAHAEWKANHARVSAELVAALRAAGVLPRA